MDKLAATTSPESKKTLDELLNSTNRLLDIVKHSVILLQMARGHYEGVTNVDDLDLDEFSRRSEV